MEEEKEVKKYPTTKKNSCKNCVDSKKIASKIERIKLRRCVEIQVRNTLITR